MAPMKLIAVALLVILGLLTLATDALPLGLAMIAAGAWLFTKVTVRDEERFLGALMIAGAMGAAYPFIDFAWAHISALLP